MSSAPFRGPSNIRHPFIVIHLTDILQPMDLRQGKAAQFGSDMWGLLLFKETLLHGRFSVLGTRLQDDVCFGVFLTLRRRFLLMMSW